MVGGTLTLLQGFRSMISHSTADRNTEDMPFFVFAIEAREYPPFFPSILTPSFERETKKEFRWEGLISDSFMRPNAGKICFANTQYWKNRQIANERCADTKNSTKATMPIVAGLSASPESICIVFSSSKYDGVFSCDETFEGTLFLRRPSMCCYYIFRDFNYDFEIHLKYLRNGWYDFYIPPMVIPPKPNLWYCWYSISCSFSRSSPGSSS